ncbi:MAG TPA: hypothetical protein VME67_03715 [Mycobacterium sp.]|nr:hypothetical protein [Mycobacterium sp.]HTX94010.1 hypothetical protein [Mycobacterium sp.]
MTRRDLAADRAADLAAELDEDISPPWWPLTRGQLGIHRGNYPDGADHD